MVSFQRMRDEFDEFGMQIGQKLPVVKSSRCIGLICLAASCFLLLIGIIFGYSIASKGSFNSLSNKQSEGDKNIHYVYVNNNSLSCPALQAERLITVMKEGDSFEGLVVTLSCRGDFVQFPLQIKCIRGDNGLRWSNLPVCYPPYLMDSVYWSKTINLRSVSCVGDETYTNCSIACHNDYIPIEKEKYSCNKSPCPAWSLGESHCYICKDKCDVMTSVAKPKPEALLDALGCDGKQCLQILIASDDKAAIWQNKRTGVFTFIGENNGHPCYQNNATKEYLFYTTTGSEWLVGPDFRKSHAGIQIFGNDNTMCPELTGGKNVSRLFIDSSEPSPGGIGMWTPDNTISFTCLSTAISNKYSPVKCDCLKYKVYHTVYTNKTVPKTVSYLTGIFYKVPNQEYGLVAPLYHDVIKELYLFSHHPQGKMWQVSTKLSTTPLRGILDGGKGSGCPDSDYIKWQWFNTTTLLGQQLYVDDKHVKVKCISGSHGA